MSEMSIVESSLVDPTIILELEKFLNVLKTTIPCCFERPTKLIRYDTGRQGDLKYQELLVCEEHFKLKPFQNHIVSIIDITSIYNSQSPEVQKDLI